MFKFSKIIDISWPTSEQMTAYKDRHVVRIVSTKEFERDGVRESLVTLGSHSGTHVDSPSHFLKDGVSIDQVSLENLVGPCQVLDLTQCKEKITQKDLEACFIKPGDIILFKTRNSLLDVNAPFDPQFIYLDGDAAQFLVNKKVKAVGIDYLGIERAQKGHETHKIILENNIPIIEGLRLNHVDAGNYFLCCLPLSLPGRDASPSRAILLI